MLSRLLFNILSHLVIKVYKSKFIIPYSRFDKLFPRQQRLLLSADNLCKQLRLRSVLTNIGPKLDTDCLPL